jgi:TM2 domain-containing membrane protein YozV
MFEVNLPFHKVPFWRKEKEVYIKYSYKNPSGQQKFNSCMDPTMNALNVCNGNGFCKPFDRNDIVNPIFFCRCEPGWTGPECTTKQKSQTIAWLLSLLLGFIGADQFYLGWSFWTLMKALGFFVGFMLSTLGFSRVGILLVLSYWFSDIVHIGSAPVRSFEGKVAADLPRWAFAAFTLLYFAFIGFAMGVCSVYFTVKEKRALADQKRYYGSTGGIGAALHDFGNKGP